MRRLAGGRLAVLFLGNYAPLRGLEELISAWRQVPAENALLILRGPRWWYSADLERLAADQVRAGKVVFLDPVPEEGLVASAAEADVGLIPYRPVILNNRYCCPNKLSQYMHAGLAILCNNLDFVKDLVREAGCGLDYDSDRPETLVAAVARFADDRAFTARCRENALRWGRSKFHWEAVCGPLMDSYRGLAAGGAAGAARAAGASPC
jgi:glycosyltransferase involved in cell wall biosynthesis